MRILIVLLAVFSLAGTLPAADLGCGCVPPLKAQPAKATACVCGPYCQCVPGASCGCLMHFSVAAAPQQSCPGGVCPVAPAQQPAAVLQPQQLLPGYFLAQQLDGGCPGGNCPGGNCNVQPSRGLFRRR